MHVHPVMVAVAWRALGREQLALVTDAFVAGGTGLQELIIQIVRSESFRTRVVPR